MFDNKMNTISNLQELHTFIESNANENNKIVALKSFLLSYDLSNKRERRVYNELINLFSSQFLKRDFVMNFTQKGRFVQVEEKTTREWGLKYYKFKFMSSNIKPAEQTIIMWTKTADRFHKNIVDAINSLSTKDDESKDAVLTNMLQESLPLIKHFTNHLLNKDVEIVINDHDEYFELIDIVEINN